MRHVLVPASVLLAVACSSGSSDNNDKGTGARCAPGADCHVAVPACLGLVDNNGASAFGLRIAELQPKKPAALSSGLVGALFAAAMAPKLESCRAKGDGATNWVLAFDTAGGAVRFGSAGAVTDPSAGYTLADGAATWQVTPGAEGAFQTNAADGVLNLPVSSTDAGEVFTLPISRTRVNGTLSANHSCIGSFNAAGLDPVNDCQPDAANPRFLTAGHLVGYISLEDADKVMVPAMMKSLCAFLAGDDDGGMPRKCKRDAMQNIEFHGDWCSMMDMPADARCADALEVSLDFAAQSVKLN